MPLNPGMLDCTVLVGATRPHTPRLHSPPQEADAEPNPPRKPNPLRIRMHADQKQTIRWITKEIGQHVQKQYSSQPGGFISDALLAHFSVSVSTEQRPPDGPRSTQASSPCAVFLFIGRTPLPVWAVSVLNESHLRFRVALDGWPMASAAGDTNPCGIRVPCAASVGIRHSLIRA